MAQSQVALYNMAISACGAAYTVTAVDEESIPAETCQLWYDNVRQTVLRAAHWNNAKRFVRLIQLDERAVGEWVSDGPNPGWLFSYEIPCNILAARYLSTYETFELGYSDKGRIINCNTGGDAATDAPVLCYTKDEENVSRWEPDLYQAVVYGLAAHICTPLNGKKGTAAQLFNLANTLLLEARANAGNEMHQLLQQTPESLQARGYNFTPVTPYIQPFGNLFSGTGAGVV